MGYLSIHNPRRDGYGDRCTLGSYKRRGRGVQNTLSLLKLYIVKIKRDQDSCLGTGAGCTRPFGLGRGEVGHGAWVGEVFYPWVRLCLPGCNLGEILQLAYNMALQDALTWPSKSAYYSKLPEAYRIMDNLGLLWVIIGRYSSMRECLGSP